MMYHRQIGNTSSKTSYDVIMARKRVKHGGACLSPHGWVTVTFLALRQPRDFSGVQFRANSTKVLRESL